MLKTATDFCGQVLHFLLDKHIERAFGKLYGVIRPFWELPLDEVIMAPNMIKKIGGA